MRPSSVAVLFVALNVASIGAAGAWNPCALLSPTLCWGVAFNESSTLASIGTPAPETGLGGASTGQWSLAGGVLRESSRSERFTTSPCIDSLGQVLWLDGAKISVGDERQVRVKVRLTSTSGGAGIIYAEKDTNNYFRFAAELNPLCSVSGAAVRRLGGNFELVKYTGYAMRQNAWMELRVRVYQRSTRYEQRNRASERDVLFR